MAVAGQGPSDDEPHRDARLPSQSAAHLLILLPVVPERVLTPTEPEETPGSPSRDAGFVWDR